jgi:hypothetical protein
VKKPQAPLKSSAVQQGSSGSGDLRTLPNDPERQGNIWSRYEQLENSTKSLSNVNQQLIDERGQRKKVNLHILSIRVTPAPLPELLSQVRALALLVYYLRGFF